MSYCYFRGGFPNRQESNPHAQSVPIVPQKIIPRFSAVLLLRNGTFLLPAPLLIVPRFRGSSLGGMVNRLPPPNLVSLLPDTILRKEGDIDEAKLFPYLSIVHLQSETRKRPLAGFRRLWQPCPPIQWQALSTAKQNRVPHLPGLCFGDGSLTGRDKNLRLPALPPLQFHVWRGVVICPPHHRTKILEGVFQNDFQSNPQRPGQPGIRAGHHPLPHPGQRL